MRGSRGSVSRLTSRQKEEITSTFYGIDHDTCQVDRVSVTRGRVLTRQGQGLREYRHPIPTDETPESEIRIVFQLTDMIQVPTLPWVAKLYKGRIAELEAEAERMRAERYVLGTDGTP